ncbi:MAG TPA: bifunctional oligoribonuclease/PAP phosphatase NrnA [bacterium]|nr:bifunctional oligoribonuclease/PAP phosphatase NrnA [bacterium]
MTSAGEFLRATRRVKIVTHVEPDGDALGSALGLAWILEAAGKEARVHLPVRLPRMYEYLPGGKFLVIGETIAESFDRVTVVDCTSPERLGSIAKTALVGAAVLNIDHHADNTRFGDVAHVDPGAAATAILIAEICREAGFKIGPEAAECLYTGILTDTGRFTFGNTDERALRAAADMIGAGADPGKIASRVYEHRPVSTLRLLGKALATLDLREDGRVACMHVTHEMIAETGALPEETEGFAAYARSLQGVQVGIFLREAEDGSIKASFRSTGGVPVDGIASQFAGGGHPAAAGARLPGPLATAKERILRAVGEHLQARAGSS